MMRGGRQVICKRIFVARNLHQPPEFDPMVKSRENLAIITMPTYYKGSLKKIKRAIRFEDTMAVKQASKRRGTHLKMANEGNEAKH